MFCLRPLCELQSALLSTHMINVTTHTGNSGETWGSLLHFTAVFQGEDKSIERGETSISRHVESFSFADGEIV